MDMLMEHRDISLDYATLEWGIKESFRDYFERLPDHDYGLTAGARKCSDGQIEFPANPTAAQNNTFAFQGIAQLSAHFGALSVKIANPHITLNQDGSATLSAEVDEVDNNPVRMVIANLLRDDSSIELQPHLRFRAVLAEEGQYLFMGNYFAGDAMDPVTIWFATR